MTNTNLTKTLSYVTRNYTGDGSDELYGYIFDTSVY